MRSVRYVTAINGHKGLYGEIVGGEYLKDMFDFPTKCGLRVACFSGCSSVSCDVSESIWACLSGSQYNTKVGNFTSQLDESTEGKPPLIGLLPLLVT